MSLRKPMKELIASKRVRVQGKARATAYLPASRAAGCVLFVART